MKNENLVIKPRKTERSDGYKIFSFKIKEETAAKIDDIATQTGHSRNKLIGTFIEYALNHCVVETNSTE